MPQERFANKPDLSVIRGWRERLYKSSDDLSSLVPFISLIAIFDGEEQQIYQEIINNSDTNNSLPQGFTESFNRAFDIEIQGENSSNVSNINKILLGEERGGLKGIELTNIETQSIQNRYTGGFGVKSLKTEKTSANPLAETFTLECTLTNPNLLKEKFEFNKLLSVGTFFLIMYGWSVSVPERSRNSPLVIDLSTSGLNNRGYWRYSFVQLHKFDFSFNQLGQMDGQLSLIAAQNTEMLFNVGGKINNISKAVLYFLNSRLLGGPKETDRFIRNLGVFNPNDLGDASISDDPDFNSASFIQNALRQSDIENDSSEGGKRKDRFTSTLLAMNGFFGKVRIVSNFIPGVNVASNIANNALYETGGLATSTMAILGDYLGPELGFVPSTTPIEFGGRQQGSFSTLPKSGGIGNPNILTQEKLMGNSKIRFFKIIEVTGEDENRSVRLERGDEAFGGRYYAQRIKFGGEQRASADLREYSETIRLGSPRFDNQFLGKSLVASGDIVLDRDVAPYLANLPEGIIVTSVMSKRVSVNNVPLINSNGVLTGFKTQDFPTVGNEDIKFYYLGWIIEAFKYYNTQFGGSSFDIKHTDLPNSISETLTPKFIKGLNAGVDTEVESGDNFDNKYRFAIDYGETLVQGKEVYRQLTGFDVPENNGSGNRSWNNNEPGLYYSDYKEERHSFALPKPDVDSFWNGDVLSSNNIGDGVIFFSRYTEGIKRGNNNTDVFVPIGSWIPIQSLRVEDGENSQQSVVLYGSSFNQGKIENTCQLPMDADKVDDILNNSVGKNFQDILMEILQKTCMIEGLGLTMTVGSDGFNKILPANTLDTDSQRLSLDWDLEGNGAGDNFTVSFRTKNSLVREIGVSSKLDPNVSFLYNASLRSIGSKVSILANINDARTANPNLGGLSDFASKWLREYGEQNDENASIINTLQTNAAVIDGFNTNNSALPESASNVIENLPEDLLSAYLQQDYRLYKKINILAMNENDYVNKMFTYYLNQLTLNIHGTVGLEPFTYVQLRNVSDLIDGFYAITSISDSIDQSSFETELGVMLILPGTQVIPELVPIQPPPAPGPDGLTDDERGAAAAAEAGGTRGAPVKGTDGEDGEPPPPPAPATGNPKLRGLLT